METLIETAREAVAQVPRDAVPAAARAAAYPAMNSNRDATSRHGTRSDIDSGSQESHASASSSSSAAAPRLESSQSNLSSASVPETELTSPTVSSQLSASQRSHNGFVAVNQGERSARPETPGLDTAQHATATANEAGATSYMAVDAQTLAQGSKRTASGTVKAAPGSHSRNASLDSNMSRIGVLSAELKSRLAYALVKVQNGWEQKSIAEVETIASQRSTPMLQTPTSANCRNTTDSPARRRTSSYEDMNYMASPGQTTPAMMRALNGHSTGAYKNPDSRPTTSSTVTSIAPSLAPAADIVPQRRPRRSLSNVLAAQGTQHESAMPAPINTPTTPTAKTRPPGILRLPSQQAEMDAVDSLIFMSSPNNSAFKHASANSTAQPSPLRPEFAGVKRVAFDERSSSVSSNEGLGSRMAYAVGSNTTPQKRMRAD